MRHVHRCLAARPSGELHGKGWVSQNSEGTGRIPTWWRGAKDRKPAAGAKIASGFIGGWKRYCSRRDALPQTISLVRSEGEHLVFHNRRAEGGAKLILLIVRD